MIYRLLLTRAAEKDLDRLHAPLREDVLHALRALADNPRPHGCKKLEGDAYNWRVRVRTYRILYTIQDSEHTVCVYRIKHRSQAYR